MDVTDAGQCECHDTIQTGPACPAQRHLVELESFGIFATPAVSIRDVVFGHGRQADVPGTLPDLKSFAEVQLRARQVADESQSDAKVVVYIADAGRIPQALVHAQSLP